MRAGAGAGGRPGRRALVTRLAMMDKKSGALSSVLRNVLAAHAVLESMSAVKA